MVESMTAGESMADLMIEVRAEPPGPDDDGRLSPLGGRRTSTVALESFEARAPEIAAALRKVAETMRGELDRTAATPGRKGWDLDTVELGIELSLEAEAGVVITRAAAGATLSATLTWKRSAER